MWHFPDSYYFESLHWDLWYGIFDTELNSFVRNKYTHKSAWAKSHHAKSAFANACWTKISEQTRYEVRKLN